MYTCINCRDLTHHVAVAQRPLALWLGAVTSRHWRRLGCVGLENSQTRSVAHRERVTAAGHDKLALNVVVATHVKNQCPSCESVSLGDGEYSV